MFRAIVLIVLLSISLVRAGIFTARENVELESSSLLFNRPRASKNALTQTKNVFGKDDRTPMESTDYPWRAIGKLSTGCTGALIVRNR
jgi:V8-like Glu-specific endopeptidase